MYKYVIKNIKKMKLDDFADICWKIMQQKLLNPLTSITN